jgi:predicted hydrocarbon binding protein/predicted amino acid-binding ACT domain protein
MEISIPKKTFTFINAKPNEEIYEICIALKDVCGAVASAAEVLSNANVNICTSSLFKADDSVGVGYWTSFIDTANANKNIKEIEKALRNLSAVQDVRVAKPEPLAYDVMHFPIMHGGSAAMIMPVELFGSLFEEIEKILTPSGFAAVFYNAGKKSGAYMTELFRKRNGIQGQTLLAAIVQGARAIGWGEIVDVNVAHNSGSVKIRKCFEALLRSNQKGQVCHWTRGFIAGVVSQTKGVTVEAVELRCAANGDDLCEFEIRPCTERRS